MLRKILIFLGVFSGVIIFIFFCILLVLHLLITPGNIRYMIIGNVSSSLRSDVSLGDINLNILKGIIEINNFEAVERKPSVFIKSRDINPRRSIKIKKIYFDFDILPLLRGEVILRNLYVTGLDMNLLRVPSVQIDERKYERGMFNFINTTIVDFMVDGGNITLLQDPETAQTVIFKNIRLTSKDMAFKTPFSLNFSCDVGFKNEKMKLNSRINFDIIDKTIFIEGVHLKGKKSFLELKGNIKDITETPAIDLEVYTTTAILSEFKNILGISYYKNIFPKDKEIKLRLQGSPENIQISPL